jgi:hypothetical protein
MNMTRCDTTTFNSLTKRLELHKSIDEIASELCPNVKHSRKKIIRWITDFYGDQYLKDHAEILKYQVQEKGVKKFTPLDDTPFQQLKNVLKKTGSLSQCHHINISKNGDVRISNEEMERCAHIDLKSDTDFLIKNTPREIKRFLHGLSDTTTVKLENNRLKFDDGDDGAELIVEPDIDDVAFHMDTIKESLINIAEILNKEEFNQFVMGIKNLDFDAIFKKANE